MRMTFTPRVGRKQPLSDAELARVEALTGRKNLSGLEHGELRALQLRADQPVADRIGARLAAREMQHRKAARDAEEGRLL